MLLLTYFLGILYAFPVQIDSSHIQRPSAMPSIKKRRIDSIKRKTGYKNLLCEMTNEGFDYDEVNINTVPVTQLSLGDILIAIGKYDI